jgi:hypothetical protein
MRAGGGVGPRQVLVDEAGYPTIAARGAIVAVFAQRLAGDGGKLRVAPGVWWTTIGATPRRFNGPP